MLESTSTESMMSTKSSYNDYSKYSRSISQNPSDDSLSGDCFDMSNIAQITSTPSLFTFPTIEWDDGTDDGEEDNEYIHGCLITRNSTTGLHSLDDEEIELIPRNHRLESKPQKMSRTKSLKRSLDSLNEDSTSLFGSLINNAENCSCTHQEWNDNDETSDDPWGQFITTEQLSCGNNAVSSPHHNQYHSEPQRSQSSKRLRLAK